MSDVSAMRDRHLGVFGCSVHKAMTDLIFKIHIVFFAVTRAKRDLHSSIFVGCVHEAMTDLA